MENNKLNELKADDLPHGSGIDKNDRINRRTYIEHN